MPYATINKPTQHFNTVTYTADDTSPRTLTGFGHQPDFVWVKHRGSGSVSHTLVDRVRGGDKMLASNGMGAEDTKSHGEITSWNADGITVADGTNGTYPRLYFNDFDPFGASVGGNYVAWSWKASNTTAVSNTAGTISSTVSVNPTAGFSIVSWTGNGTVGATVGHGLGVAPSFFILKDRSNVRTWICYHKSIGNTGGINLNETGAASTSNAAFWNNTSPTSSVFSVSTYSNESSPNYITYCFAEVKGFSKFGSYTGNGSADGTFVYTGFKPAFVLIKCSSAAENWHIFDDTRNTFNPTDKDLRPNLVNAETTSSVSNIDFLSNGFKLRNSDADYNGSGRTYIYAAFAEQPLVGTNNVPATAR